MKRADVLARLGQSRFALRLKFYSIKRLPQLFGHRVHYRARMAFVCITRRSGLPAGGRYYYLSSEQFLSQLSFRTQGPNVLGAGDRRGTRNRGPHRYAGAPVLPSQKENPVREN
jgi:hypothetical protein